MIKIKQDNIHQIQIDCIGSSLLLLILCGLHVMIGKYPKKLGMIWKIMWVQLNQLFVMIKILFGLYLVQRMFHISVP